MSGPKTRSGGDGKRSGDDGRKRPRLSRADTIDVDVPEGEEGGEGEGFFPDLKEDPVRVSQTG